jgi:hypothetical protein
MAAPAPAAADDSFPVGDNQVELAAGREKLVYVGPGRQARPMEGFGTASRALPGARRGRYGGLDVGTDRGGGTLLVYARCRRTCDLFSYSFARGRERRIEGGSTGACDERDPRIDRGVLTFRRARPRGARRPCRSGLYLKRPSRRSRRVMRSAPRDYDYAGGVIAFEVAEEEEASGATVTEIRLRRLGRRGSSLVWRASEEDGGTGNAVQRPQLDGGFVYWWVRDRSTPAPGQQLPAGIDGRNVNRRPVRGTAVTALERDGRLFTGPVRDTLRDFAVAGDRLYYTYGGSPLRIGMVSGRPAFPTPIAF